MLAAWIMWLHDERIAVNRPAPKRVGQAVAVWVEWLLAVERKIPVDGAWIHPYNAPLIWRGSRAVKGIRL